MTELGAFPQPAVLLLGDCRPEDLERQARGVGHRWLRVDCASAADKAGVMDALARGLGLPPHFGRNLDALYDCLTDLEPGGVPGASGLVVVVQNLPDGARFGARQREALLEVFRDAGDDFAARAIAFRMFYSVRRGARRSAPA